MNRNVIDSALGNATFAISSRFSDRLPVKEPAQKKQRTCKENTQATRDGDVWGHVLTRLSQRLKSAKSLLIYPSRCPRCGVWVLILYLRPNFKLRILSGIPAEGLWIGAVRTSYMERNSCWSRAWQAIKLTWPVDHQATQTWQQDSPRCPRCDNKISHWCRRSVHK